MSTRDENLINERTRLIRRRKELDKVIEDIELSGTASASISSTGGSKTYSRLNLSELKASLKDLDRRIIAINRALAGLPSINIRHIMTTRCGYA